MCRALKVLCAASGAERLAELKRATVSVHWELVGGAASAEELAPQAELHRPDVIVVEAALGPASVASVLSVRPQVRVVALGPLEGSHAVASSLEDIGAAILGTPRAGPVTR
jgi:hypothetical protein